MEAVKAWPLKHLFHLTIAPYSLRRSSLFIRCCSSSSSAAAAPATRNRRSSSTSSSTEAVRAIRLQKIEEFRSKGIEPYAYRWDRTHSANQLQQIYKTLESGEERNADVSVAGRIVARRAFGKLAFFSLRDGSGTIQIVSELRRTVESFGFLEVETPVLQGAAGGAEARPFVTYHNSLGRDLYLRIATEFHLKRMMVGGFEKVYEIWRIFRNEGISNLHNPEFTTIEMYEAYESMINLAEEIVTRCALAVHGKLTINYQGEEINLERPWRRETMHNLVKEATSIDFHEFENDLEAAKEVTLRTLGDLEKQEKAAIGSCPSVGHLLNEVFEIIIEPKLLQPTFVLNHPVEISPLAKRHRRHAGLTERFELFICGHELANAFSELTDPVDQRGRLEEQVRQHNAKGTEAVSETDNETRKRIEMRMSPMK